MVEWAVSAIRDGREADVFDPEIGSSKNSIGEMVKLLHVGVACSESDPDQRPDINEAIRMIGQVNIEGGGGGGDGIGAGSGSGSGSSQDRTVQAPPSPAAAPQSNPRDASGEISPHRSDSSEERSEDYSSSVS